MQASASDLSTFALEIKPRVKSAFHVLLSLLLSPFFSFLSPTPLPRLPLTFLLSIMAQKVSNAYIRNKQAVGRQEATSATLETSCTYDTYGAPAQTSSYILHVRSLMLAINNIKLRHASSAWVPPGLNAFSSRQLAVFRDRLDTQRAQTTLRIAFLDVWASRLHTPYRTSYSWHILRAAPTA